MRIERQPVTQTGNIVKYNIAELTELDIILLADGMSQCDTGCDSYVMEARNLLAAKLKAEKKAIYATQNSLIRLAEKDT